jgi:hypothetical protein
MAVTGRPQVFLSHAHEDADFANALRTWLDDSILGAADFFVSSDRGSIPLGSEWAERIRAALAQSALMLILVSPASASRRWLYFEAGAGYVKGIPVIPMCVAGMTLPDLEPPLSLLEGIELPGADAQSRLLEIIASSAGVRAPTRVEDLVLPGRTSGLRPVFETPSAAALEADPFADLTRAKAVALLKDADDAQVQLVRALVREALFVTELTRWPGNRAGPTELLQELRPRLTRPVLIPQDVAAEYLARAEEIAARSLGDVPDDEQLDIMKGFAIVREMVAPMIEAFPDVLDYEIALFQHPPETYLSLLILEISSERPLSHRRWHLARLIADSEHSAAVLPYIEHVLRDLQVWTFEHTEAVQLARSVLGGQFDEWYERVRGRPLEEDEALLRKASDDRYRRMRAEEEEEERRS